MNTPIDSKSAGLRNEKLVLSLIRQHGQLSQAQLCRLARLSSSTVSYIVGRLRDKAMIVESPGESDKRGAKPTILTINPKGSYVLGAEVKPSGISLGMFDFTGALVKKTKASNDGDTAPEKMTKILGDTIDEFLSGMGIDADKVLGIGVTLSGSITPEGVVELSSPMNWKNVHFEQMIQEKTTIPVELFPTRVRLLSEMSDSHNAMSTNILYLNLANGVGGSVLIDGQLVTGETGRMCELGHISIDPNGPVCGCGNKGCFEAYISGPAITKKIQSDLAAGTESSLKALLAEVENTPESVVEKWGQAIKDGDSYALQLREAVANHVAQLAAIAINCFDPQLVLLAGYVSQQCPDYLIDTIAQRISTSVYDSKSREIEILAGSAGDEALIRGGALAVLQDSMRI